MRVAKRNNNVFRHDFRTSAPTSHPLSDWFDATRGALCQNTERALRADLEVFQGWCERREIEVWPAQEITVARFIDVIAREKAPATVRRYISSIAALHKAAGWKNPLLSTKVKMALKRMYLRKGRRQMQALGLTWSLRQKLVAAAGNRLIDARNRALLAVAYDAMLRRSELVSLQVSDLLEETDGSATLLVRRGKTDQSGEGAMLFLAPDTFALLRDWLKRAGITEGRMFRSVRKGDSTGETLDASQVSRIFKAMARKAGLHEKIVEHLSAHSTRVGAAQDMIASGIELPAVLQAGRWKNPAMVNRYGERLLARRGGAAQLAKLQHRGSRRGGPRQD